MWQKLVDKKKYNKNTELQRKFKKEKGHKTDKIKPYQSTEQVKGEAKRQIARENAQSKYENEIYRFANIVNSFRIYKPSENHHKIKSH